MLFPTRAFRALSFVAVLFTLPATATRADTLLRWKFTPGETLHYVSRFTIKMTTAAKTNTGAPPVTMTTTMTSDDSLAVKSVDDDGAASITHTITRMQAKMESPQGILGSYDSASDSEPEGMLKMHAPTYEAMVNRPISFKMSPRGEVSDVQVPQALVDAVVSRPGMEKMGGMFSGDTIERIGSLSRLPEKAVSPGDTWTGEKQIPYLNLGTMIMKSTNQYAGTETRSGKTLEKIRVTQKMELNAGEESSDATVKLKEQNTSGTTWFDNVAGRLAETVAKATVNMEVSTLGITMEMDMEMDIRMTLEPAGPSEESTTQQ